MTDSSPFLPIALSRDDWPEIMIVWETSVRATHDFLKEQDLLFYKTMIRDRYLHEVELSGIRKADGSLAGFAGIAEESLEMLFVRPSERGKGVGKALLQYVIRKHGIRKTEVNEQNRQALEFYEHAGFRIVGRSATDGCGRPYPIYRMELTLKTESI